MTERKRNLIETIVVLTLEAVVSKEKEGTL